MHGGGWNAIDHSYADDMVRDGTVPWRGVTLHTMRGTYLPLIENAEKQGDVEEGTCDYLKKRVLPELKK
jgi:hypothetical protein